MIAIICNILLTVLIQTSSFEEQLKNILDEKLKEYSRYEFEYVNAPKDFNDVILTNEHFKLSNGNCYLSIKSKVNGIYSNSYLQLKIKLFKSVAVTKTKIKKGEQFTSENLKIEEREVSKIRDSYFANANNLFNKESLRDIKAEEIVFKEFIRKTPIIKKGDSIIAFVEKGSIEISFDAIAKQDGAEGDAIIVQNKDKKNFVGKVIDKKTVNIE